MVSATNSTERLISSNSSFVTVDQSTISSGMFGNLRINSSALLVGLSRKFTFSIFSIKLAEIRFQIVLKSAFENPSSLSAASSIWARRALIEVTKSDSTALLS